MSMIDKTFDPWPKRAHRHGRPASGAQTWFGQDTGWSAQHYCDLSWVAVLLPVGVGAVLIGLAALVSAPELASVLGLAAAGFLIFGLRRTVMRLIATLRRAD